MHTFHPSRRGAMLAALAAAALAGTPAFAADPIRIGTSGPLSGSLSLLGQGVRDGLEVYFRHINDQGGINGRKVELIAEDDGYDPMRTLAAARKLSEQDKVVAFISPVGTPGVAALIPYATERRTPIVGPYAFSHTLTSPTKKYVFTTLSEVRVQAGLIGDYVTGKLKAKRVAVIYQNDDFGQDAVIGLEERMKKTGVSLTKLPYERGSTNFSGVVAQARESGADNVVFLGIPVAAALVMKEAGKMGWKPQFSGHNALGDPQTFELAGAALAEGAIAVALMEPLDSSKPQVAEFIARQKKYLPRTKPTTYSMHGYNVAQLVAEVIKRVPGEPTGEKIAAELEKVRDLNMGLMGPLTFTADRHAGSDSVAFMRAQSGKWVLVTDWVKAQ